MKRSKQTALSVIVIICVTIASFGTTLAWLISNDYADNQLTVGETRIELIEDYDPPAKLSPGTSFTKKPYVENTGNLPCYVRMRADFSDNRAEEFCDPLNIDTSNWVYDPSDGYYYYKSLLQPGESTTNLFTTVRIKTTCSQADLIDFDILIYAEAVQHTDHAGSCPTTEYKTVWD